MGGSLGSCASNLACPIDADIANVCSFTAKLGSRRSPSLQTYLIVNSVFVPPNILKQYKISPIQYDKINIVFS
jgi:hypothetical protein